MNKRPGNGESSNEKPVLEGVQLGNPQKGNEYSSAVVITGRSQVINKEVVDKNDVTWIYNGEIATMRMKDEYGRVDQKSVRTIYLDDDGWERIT